MADEKSIGIPGAQPSSGGGGQMLIFLVFMLAMIMVLNNDLRRAAGLFVGSLLSPLIGFGGAFPVWTIVLASILLVTLSTVSRHIFTDWVAVAKTQAMTQNYSKELRDARLANDVDKVKKLIDLQPEVTRATMESTSSQMKTTVFTMLLAIGIFTWLGVFIDQDVLVKAISVPGSDYFILTNKGPAGISPLWVWIYSLFSIPLGQAMQGGLKYWSFKRRLKKIDAGETSEEKRSLTGAPAVAEDGKGKEVKDKGKDDNHKLDIVGGNGEDSDEDEIEIVDDKDMEIEDVEDDKKKSSGNGKKGK